MQSPPGSRQRHGRRRPSLTKGARPATTRPGGPTGWSRMTHLGHEYLLPPPRLSVWYRLGKGTFAGPHGNGQEAPIADIASDREYRPGSTPKNHSWLGHSPKEGPARGREGADESHETAATADSGRDCPSSAPARKMV